MTELFTLPIQRQGIATADGHIVATSPAPQVYLLTFTSPSDNRLTASLLHALHLALTIIEHRYPRGVVITTSGIPKFYSNGLDLDHLRATPHFVDEALYPVFKKLSTYPMPTIALLNGHAFAGGLLLAMHHDYRFMNPAKGYVCMNEMDFGALMDSPFLGIFREKVSARTYRDTVLEARRFGAREAVEAGLVDGTATGVVDVLKIVEERGLVKKGVSGVYGRTKEDMYRQIVGLLGDHKGNQRWRFAMDQEREAEGREAVKRMEAWEEKGGKAKL